jgi:large subunit ribosomal protein L25
MDAHEHPGSALGVVADDGMLAVPAGQELFEAHTGTVDGGLAPPLHPATASGREQEFGYTPAPGMAGDRTKLIVTQRETLGSAESRRLRKEGLVPGVLYGDGEPVAISIAERELRRALTGSAGLHSILDVEIDGKGKTHASILKEYQVDPVRGGVTHVDLQEVRLDQAIRAAVSVQLHGGEDAPGVREGGVLSQPLREVTVEALPLEVPERLEVDVSDMEVGGTLRVSDLVAPDGVELVDDPEMVVATVTAPTRVVEPEPTEEELAEAEAAAEGEEAAEGEAAEGAAEAEQDADASGDQGTDEG